MSKTKATVLASNCFSVKGYNKSLLIDFQNNEWYHVDFNLLSNESINEDDLKPEELEHLLKRQILIRIPEELKNNFPALSTEFDVPSIIESAIVDRNAKSQYSLNSTFEWFDSLMVKLCEVRFYDLPAVSELASILSLVEDTHIESINFILPYSQELVEFFEKSLVLNPKINDIVYHGSERVFVERDDPDKRRVFIREKLTSSDSCGNVHPTYFSNTKQHILKSMNYNSCLYKKVGVDVDGNIKNCPSMKESLGHVKSVESILLKDLETKYWSIKKDDIEVCKDCEFRYICNDCRVRVPNKNGRPETCIYNPYTNLWKGQEGYVDPKPIV